MSTRSGLEAVYGRNPVRELLAARRRRVEEVRALASMIDGEPWLRDAAAVRPATRAELGRLAGSADHQGVVALAEPYPYVEADDLLGAPGAVVCLDGAQDPRNLGAIARVCDAVGAAGIAIARRGSPGVTPAVAKTSAGAVEHVAIARVGSPIAFVHDARGRGRLTVGADPAAGRDYRDLEWPADAILVMGAEGEGLRPRMRDQVEVLVAIPMAGRVDSLNISVATALLLFEAARGGGRA
jgi:23S rRNA (guanosine2251-2'-O)-methyltransferase